MSPFRFPNTLQPEASPSPPNYESVQQDPTSVLQDQISQGQGLERIPGLPQSPPISSTIQQQIAREQQQLDALTPTSDRGGPIKRLLFNMFQGGSEALRAELGMPTHEQLRQQHTQNILQLTNAQSLDSQRQANEQYRQILGQQYQRQPVFGMSQFGIPDGTQMTPKEQVTAMMAFNAGQQRIQGQLQVGQQAGQFGLQKAAITAGNSAAGRDNRYISLMGQDPKTWTPEDQRFVTGYNKYVDVTKVQPGVERMKTLLPVRWAALDPQVQGRIAIAKGLASGTTGFGPQITSFNAFLGHAADLNDSFKELGNTDARFMNMPINELRRQTGNPAITGVLAKIEPVQKEFESILLNNKALYEDDRKSVAKIVDPNSSPAQMLEAIKSLTGTAGIRLGAINSTIKRVAGVDVPGIVDPANGQFLEEMGAEIPGYVGADSINQLLPPAQQTVNRQQARPSQSGDFGAAMQSNGQPYPEGHTGKTSKGTPIVVRGGRWVRR